MDRENSGAEPGQPVLADGRHVAYLVRIAGEKRTLTFDVVQFLTGEQARVAYEKQGGEAGGPPNDYLIVNDNPRLRTLPVAGDVVVTLLRTGEQSAAGADPKPGTWAELPDYLDRYHAWGGDEAAKGYPGQPFDLTVADGKITKIAERFIP